MAQGQGSYSIPPPAPRSGNLVLSYLGELRRWIMRNNTIAGAGLTSIQTESGRVLSVKRPGDKEMGKKPFRIYQSNGNIMNIPMSDAMTGYAPDPETPSTLNWSLEFSVTNSALDDFTDNGADPPVMTNPIGTSAMDDGESPPGENTELYDGDAEPETPVAQTYTRIAIVRGGEWVCTGGVFRENTFCAGSRGPIVELARR